MEDIEIDASDPADAAALPAEVVMETVAVSGKEAEASISLELESQEITADELPAIECREMPDTEPLPGRFAGPVPDSMANDNARMQLEADMQGRSPHNGLTIEEPTVSRGKAVFAIDDRETGFEETIVITAPFGIYSNDADESAADADWKRKLGRAAKANPATTAAQPATPGNAAAEPAELEQAETDPPENQAQETEPPQRRGFFRRLLTAIHSPFGRRKRA
jgi:hypothetical protein